MYLNTQFCIKTDKGLTKSFSSTTGVKQGCNLGLLLSKIYQNDLHDIFYDTCFPVKLGNISINSLSWADDLVLFSDTALGLQNCLDKLNNYCNKWNLTVNCKKTKCMVFQNQRKDYPDLFFMVNTDLEIVKEYTYLGVTFSSNGKFTTAISNRVNKANRAIYVLRQTLTSVGNANINPACSLFDKQIQPIIMYGCPIWG